MGLEIDPVNEAQASALLEEGIKLLKEGSLRAAIPKLDAALELMPFKSRVGGEAFLQKAICVDSLGQGDVAKGERGRGRDCSFWN
jgi:hypothetical protein